MKTSSSVGVATLTFEISTSPFTSTPSISGMTCLPPLAWTLMTPFWAAASSMVETTSDGWYAPELFHDLRVDVLGLYLDDFALENGLLQFPWRGHGDYLAVVYDCYSVAELVSFFHVVRGEENRAAFLSEGSG